MLLYYSGTGNSRYVGEKLASLIGDRAFDMFYKIKTDDKTPLHSDKPWIIVTPTYAWRLPHIVTDLLSWVALDGSREIYFVLTCGDSIGNAGKYAEKFAQEKGMIYKGCAEIIMPENYLALFDTPDDEEALRIIGASSKKIDRLADRISAGADIGKSHITFSDRLKSGIVNACFYFFIVKAKKFYVKDTCISCRKCEHVCPLGNVTIVLGRPTWGKKCTHCMACIAKCPVHAIEYGKATQNRNRYVFPESLMEKVAEPADSK